MNWTLSSQCIILLICWSHHQASGTSLPPAFPHVVEQAESCHVLVVFPARQGPPARLAVLRRADHLAVPTGGLVAILGRRGGHLRQPIIQVTPLGVDKIDPRRGKINDANGSCVAAPLLEH